MERLALPGYPRAALSRRGLTRLSSRGEHWDLVASGRTVRDVAASLGVAEPCLYGWKSRELVDRDLKPDPASSESAALGDAQRPIRELEDDVKILRAAASAVEKVVPPQDRYQLVADLVDDGVHARRACQELGVLRSGLHDWRSRAPSPRAIPHAWSTNLISTVHLASRATYRGRATGCTSATTRSSW